MSGSGRFRTRPSDACSEPSSKAGAKRPDPTDPLAAPRAVYVHIPFCTRRCEYCDFATVVYDPSAADRYLDRLEQELAGIPRGLEASTLYVGGGTPSSLTQVQFKRLLSSLYLHIDLGSAEVTVEMNPETVDGGKLESLKNHFVGRISLGNQSFDAAVLKALGRDHDPGHSVRAIDLLRQFGFRNISVDLMFAAPGESLEQVDRDLDRLEALDLPHVSAYCLTYEPGTPLTARWRNGQVIRQEEEAELVQYRRVRDRLRTMGLEQYEISNYSVPGCESAHNRVYWSGGSYYGIGLGAGSYVDGIRRENTRSLREYLGDWPEPHRPPHQAERLDDESRARERVVLALRTNVGLDENHLRASTGFSLNELYPDGRVRHLLEIGLLESLPPHLRLSERGMELADSVFVELV